MRIMKMSRYSDGLRSGRPGFESRQGKGLFLLYSVQTSSVANPASYPMVLSSEVKRLGIETNLSPPSSAEAENDGAIPPLLHMLSWPNA
jgi:hypothetical protein